MFICISGGSTEPLFSDGFATSADMSNVMLTPTIPVKKKILIFTSKGGYGHQATTQALCDLLGSTYDIEVINPFERFMGSADILRKMTSGKYDGEKLYNKMLQKGWTRLLNTMANMGSFIIRNKQKKIARRIANHLQAHHYDLVISVISFLNGAISNASHQSGLPFLLITTDGDLMHWMHGVNRSVLSGSYVTVGFDIAETRGRLLTRGAANNNVIPVGFPIRKDFYEHKNKEVIRRQFDIPERPFTAMLLMGGAGSNGMYDYVKQMLRMKLPMHLIACVGKNEQLARQITKKYNKLCKSSSVTLTVVPFTKRVSDLMAVSDVLITKAGPGTIYEALHMKLPVLIDCTTPLLAWEKANATFIEEHGFGHRINHIRELSSLLKHYHEKDVVCQKTMQRLNRCRLHDFTKEIPTLVEAAMNRQAELDAV